MVEISAVKNNSSAHKAGIRSGDKLLRINGREISDVLDYSFYITPGKNRVTIMRDGEEMEYELVSSGTDELGLQFETYLMDKKRSCTNKCVFCFIDQNPEGMRESIYFKDDDSRLSFLQGNYVTLTNMSDGDIDRIIRMRTSPINVSVHTTNPELRVKMLHNRFAGKVLGYMRRLAEGKITMNCQIVLCKGLNDGNELERTMNDLEKLYPQVNSVSVVPVGLTKFRKNLYPLEPFSQSDAESVIDMVESKAKECFKKHGSRIFFCADEFYIKAKRPLHGEKYYEDFSQIENGVGLISSMKTEFDGALERLTPDQTKIKRTVSIGTGVASYGFIKSLCASLKKKCPGFDYEVYAIVNDFYGHNVTVSGLLTGRDIVNQLRGKNLGQRLFLASSMLKADEDILLDGYTPQMLEEELNVKIVFNGSNGAEFLHSLLND